jgi:hypothetical protein
MCGLPGRGVRVRALTMNKRLQTIPGDTGKTAQTG